MFRLLTIIFLNLILATGVHASASGDATTEDGKSKDKKEEVLDDSKPYEIKGDAPTPIIDPIVDKMSKKIILYEKRQTYLKEKEKKEKERAKKDKELLEKAIKNQDYVPKKPTVFPKDILNAFKEIGVPLENIELEGRDLHDYAIKLVCDGKENITDLTKSPDSADIDLDRLSLRISDICNLENRYREW